MTKQKKPPSWLAIEKRAALQKETDKLWKQHLAAPAGSKQEAAILTQIRKLEAEIKQIVAPFGSLPY